MYFIIVIFQFYLLFPILLKLMRSISHHGVVMAASVGVGPCHRALLALPLSLPPGK